MLICCSCLYRLEQPNSKLSLEVRRYRLCPRPPPYQVYRLSPKQPPQPNLLSPRPTSSRGLSMPTKLSKLPVQRNSNSKVSYMPVNHTRLRSPTPSIRELYMPAKHSQCPSPAHSNSSNMVLCMPARRSQLPLLTNNHSRWLRTHSRRSNSRHKQSALHLRLLNNKELPLHNNNNNSSSSSNNNKLLQLPHKSPSNNSLRSLHHSSNSRLRSFCNSKHRLRCSRNCRSSHRHSRQILLRVRLQRNRYI